MTNLIPSALVDAAIPDHQNINDWQGTATCLQCHETEAKEMFASTHYQWLGETPYTEGGTDIQGKLDMGVNSYCINITGNWNGCGACHAGLGARPTPEVSRVQLENIDCLICHQEKYKRIKVNGTFVANTAQMAISMIEAARIVHKPTRVTCSQCHAKGGGGDDYKRGDMALAHGNTSDQNFDIHMETTRGRFCMTGRGSDIRPTDQDLCS